MEKALKYRLVIWVVVIFFIILTSVTFPLQSQIQKTCLAVGFGIDKVDGQIEISAQIIIPQAGGDYSQTQEIISNRGANIAEAVSNLELETGKNLSLDHCHVLVISKSLCEENIIEHLDYLIRSNLMNNNTVLIYTNGTSKEILLSSSQLNTSDLNNLQNITNYNNSHDSSSGISLIDFVNEYMSPTSTSLFTSIEVNSTDESSSNSNNQQNNNGATTSQPSKEATTLKNDGSGVVFLEGKKVLDIKKEEMWKLNWFDPRFKVGSIQIENISDEKLKNANMNFYIKKKDMQIKPKFVNNTPIIELNLQLLLKATNITQQDKYIVPTGTNYISDTVKQAISTKIQNEANDAVQLCKDNSLDIIKAYNIFNTALNKEWKQYLSSLNSPYEYLNHLVVNVNLDATFYK